MFPVPRHDVAALITAGRVWWCGIGVAGRAKAVEAAKTAALGAEPVVGAVPGAAEHALPFYGLDDALALRRKLKALAAEGGALRVTVVGGGYVGVELAAASSTGGFDALEQLQYAVEDGLIEKPFWDELVANICLRNMDAKDEKFSNKASITSTSYHACTIKPRTPADKRERLLPNNLGNRKSPIIVALSHIKFGLRAQSKLFAKAYVAAMPKTWWCPSRETKPFRKDEDTDYLADDDDEETERMRRVHERREYATFRYTPCIT